MPALPPEVWQQRAEENLRLLRETDPALPLNRFVDRSQVRHCCTKVEGFAERWDEALVELGRKNPGGRNRGFSSAGIRRYNPEYEERLEVFLKHFAKCGRIHEACKLTTEETGKTLWPQAIGARIKDNNPNFDSEFYERYIRAEFNAVSQAEDGLKDNAILPNEARKLPYGDPMSQRFLLESRHPHYERRQKLTHEHQHQHTVLLEVIAEDLEMSSKEMFSGDVVELPESQYKALEGET